MEKKPKLILIIDYGLGNLYSVAGAVKKIGHTPLISNNIEEFPKADKLILPGVGAFSDGMKNLQNLNLIKPLTELIFKKQKPILGICLGCQLMTEESSEFGHHLGLRWIKASVTKLNSHNKELRVPHVGWDELKQVKNSPLFKDIPFEALFYYTHSFRIQCQQKENILGECDYGGIFTASFQQENIYGTQFHPEKSQLYGLKLLQNYIENC